MGQGIDDRVAAGSTPHRMLAALADGDHYRPWFQRRPRFAGWVAAVLFAVVTAVRLTMGEDATAAVTMLYALPVSLVAIGWGRAAGVGAGVLGVALIGLWVALESVSFGLVGWVSRATPLLLIGLLLGDAAERLQRAEGERSRFEAREQRHRQAVEINDGLVQGMAAAKWWLEAGRTQAGLAALDETLQEGQRLVSDLIRDTESSPGGPVRR